MKTLRLPMNVASRLKVIAASSLLLWRAALLFSFYALTTPSSLHGVPLKAILEGARHADEVVDAARLAKAATLTPETMVDEAAKAVGLGNSLPGMTEKLVDALKAAEKMGRPRLALSLAEQASGIARGAARSGSMDELQHALSLLYMGRDVIKRSEVVRFAQEPSAEVVRAFQTRARTEPGGHLLTNPDVLVATSHTRTVVLPLALEVGNEYLRLLKEFSEFSVLMLGRRGEEAQQASLQVLERLRDAAESWRWVEQAYGEAGQMLQGSFQVAKRYDESMSNARHYLAAARGEKTAAKLDPVIVNSTARREVLAPPATGKPVRREVLLDLATRERRLLAAERLQMPLPPLFTQCLVFLQRLVLDQARVPQTVMVVKKPWAANLPQGFITLMAQLLIEALVLAALVIIACPLLCTAAWVAMFFLRRNRLRMDLYSEDGGTALTGRTELGGLAKWLCVACGWLAGLCTYAVVFLLAAIVLWPVGIVFAEETEGLPGFWNLVGASAGILPCLFATWCFEAIGKDIKRRGWPHILMAGGFASVVLALTLWLLFCFTSWKLIYNPNFVFSVFLLPLGLASQRCASQFARLGHMRGPDATDFDALLLRSFARDKDTAPIVRGMTFEAALCGFLKSRGYESLAVGQPWEVFPGGAAARVYLPMHGWERFVIRYVKLARVILVVPGESLAVIWEQAVLKTFSTGTQVILLCPYETETDRRHFDAYRKNVEGKFNLPSITQSGIIVFDDKWTPGFIPLVLSGWRNEEAFYQEFAAKTKIGPSVQEPQS